MENPDAQNYQSNRLNIQILNRVRTIAVFGQLILIFVALWYLDIRLPLNWLFGIIAFETLFLLYSHQRIKDSGPIGNWEVFIHILIDSLILAGLVYFSGGANNPFTYLFFSFTFNLNIVIIIGQTCISCIIHKVGYCLFDTDRQAV